MSLVNKDDTTGKAANKSPAFQFYPKDFLTDSNVLVMSNEARGAYITLLCIDWLEDGIKRDRLCKLSGFDAYAEDGSLRSPDAWNSIEAQLLNCFKAHPEKEGYVTNPRLQKERGLQVERRKERSEAGRRGGKAKHNKALAAEAQLKLSQKNNIAKPSTSSSSTSTSTTAVFNNVNPHWPQNLDSPEARNALTEWLDYKKSRRESYKNIDSVNRLLRHWSKYTPKQFIDAVDRSIRSNYAGLIDPDSSFGSSKQPKATAFEKNLELLRRTEAEEV